ncbi:MAG: lipid A-modifier LpxR family protein [Pseudomonadota bacterium]
MKIVVVYALSCAMMIGFAGNAVAQGSETLGFGRFANNDAWGDGDDRWRTGGYSVSWMRGQGWSGSLPEMPGQIIEFRFRADVISPVDLTMPAAPERLYAGTLSAGAHLHFGWRGYEVAAGADILAIGEQTGLSSFQSSLHDQFGFPDVEISGYEVDDQFLLHATGEAGRTFDLGPVNARPFVEIQAGVETLARAGVDLTFGAFGEGALLVRDVSTGQRYIAIENDTPSGLSFVLGGDIAYVADSFYLPSSEGFELEDTRYRLRAGVNSDFGVFASGFYGLTYLSEEFEGQSEGQLVGSINIRFEF